jgi:hypothetical protein
MIFTRRRLLALQIGALLFNAVMLGLNLAAGRYVLAFGGVTAVAVLVWALAITWRAK